MITAWGVTDFRSLPKYWFIFIYFFINTKFIFKLYVATEAFLFWFCFALLSLQWVFTTGEPVGTRTVIRAWRKLPRVRPVTASKYCFSEPRIENYIQCPGSLALYDKSHHSSVFSAESQHSPSSYIKETREEDNIWDSVQISHPGSVWRCGVTALKPLIHSQLKAVFLQCRVLWWH